MRILVTGHLGYIGVEMASFLSDLGHEVAGLDTTSSPNVTFSLRPIQCRPLNRPARRDSG